MLQVEPRTVKAIRVDRPTTPCARGLGFRKKDCRRAVLPHELACDCWVCVQVWCKIHA